MGTTRRRASADCGAWTTRRSAAGPHARRHPRAGHRAGVLLARVPRRVREARLRAESGLVRQRCRRARRPRLLHEPRFVARPGRARGRRVGVRRVQAGGRRRRACAFGWTLTERADDLRARAAPARSRSSSGCCGPAGDERDARASALLERAVEPLAEPGRPLFAGLRAQWDDPSDAWTRLFHLGDMLREYRGDAHVCAWSSAGVDAIEIGLLTEAYMGLPLRTLHPHARLERRRARRGRGAAARAGLARRARRSPTTAATRARTIERATDRADGARDRRARRRRRRVGRAARPWGEQIRAAGGYVGGPVDLWPNRDD